MVDSQLVMDRGFFGPSIPSISRGALNAALKLPLLVRTFLLCLRTSTMVDLVVVLPTLPTTATRRMCGLLWKNLRMIRTNRQEMRDLNSFI